MAECGAGHASDEYLIFEAVNALTEAMDAGLLEKVLEGLDEFHLECLAATLE